MKLPGFHAELSTSKFSEQCFVHNELNYQKNNGEIVPSIDDCRAYASSGCGCSGVIGCEGEYQSYVAAYYIEDGCPCASF
jgi:hypothetical protein